MELYVSNKKKVQRDAAVDSGRSLFIVLSVLGQYSVLLQYSICECNSIKNDYERTNENL